MYDLEIKERFSKVPVFSLSDLSQMIPNRDYAKKVISRLADRGKVKRIRKDLYTFYDDPFLVATYILRPSYISGASALSHHHMITQMPKEVFCFTLKPARRYFFKEKIHFINTKFFFGFETEKYSGFDVPIATPEKALIDSIGVVPLSLVDEAFDDISAEKMILYLQKIKKSSIVKRMGFMLEAHGHDVFPALKRYLNSKYILLDPLSRGGKRNKKWKVIV